MLILWSWLYPDEGRGDLHKITTMVWEFTNSYLNGPSICSRWMFEAKDGYSQCQNLENYITPKASILADSPDCSLGRDAQLAAYRTNYEPIYDPFSDSEPDPDIHLKVLHTLYLSKMAEIGHFEGIVPCGRMFPAMQKLRLSYYDWNHSIDDFIQMWDFSRLLCLSIRCSDICRLFSSIPLSGLSKLRTLRLSRYSFELEDDITAAQNLLATVLDSCQSLESLKIDGEDWEEYLPMESIYNKGQSCGNWGWMILRKLILSQQQIWSMYWNIFLIWSTLG